MQFENLVKSWGLTINDVPFVESLVSINGITRQIRERLDTKQYIYIQQGANNYFKWNYISKEDVLILLLEDKN